MENHPRIHDRPSVKETTKSKSAILKTAFIKSIGWATHVSRKLTILSKNLYYLQLSNGEILIQFIDGSQLKLEPSGDSPIVYTDTDYTSTRLELTLVSHMIWLTRPPQVRIHEQATQHGTTKTCQSAKHCSHSYHLDNTLIFYTELYIRI